MQYLILLIYLAIALTLQLLTGDFPVAFFAFPLNVLVASLWIAGVYWLWKYRRTSRFVSFMLSRGATVCAVSVFLALCLFMGLTGKTSIVSTWVFVAFMLYFQTVLLFVIIRGWRKNICNGNNPGNVRWRFVLNHAGFLIVISSAFWGAPDSETLRLQAFKDIPVREAYRTDGTNTWLSYDIELKSFRVDTYANGVPAIYEADVLVDGEPVTLKVNHPYAKGLAGNIYLTGFDSGAGDQTEFCLIQIVREPWKYGTVAGVVMLFAGALMLFVSGPKKRSKADE